MALGIMGVISLGVVELSKNVFQLDRRMSQNVFASSLKNNIKNVLRSKEVCEKNFQGLDPVGTVITQFKDRNDNVILEKDSIVGKRVSRIKITELKIQDMPSGVPDGLPALANFSIKYEEVGKKGTLLGRKDYQFNIPILVIPEASAVKTCFSSVDSYVFASCIALKGREDSDLCKNIAIEDQIKDDNTAKLESIIDDVDGQTSNLFAVSALGDVKTETTMGVGLGANANPADKGSLTASGNLNVGQDMKADSLGVGVDPTTSTGTVKIAKSLSVGGDTPANTEGLAYVKDSVSVGAIAPSGSGNFRSTGRMGIGVSSPVGKANTSLETLNRIKIRGIMPENGLDDKHVLTKIWFTNQLAETLGLDAGARDNIEDQLKNPSQTATIKKVSEQVCSQIRVDGQSGSWNATNSTCSIGIHNYYLRVSGKNIILSTPQGDKSAKFNSCDDSSVNCNQVCSGSSCWTKMGTLKCPIGYGVVGIYNGHLACAIDKP